jgi:tetratricopeptide (TPR) repeat protein
MSNDKTKLLLILSVILVSLLSNILSNIFIELEGKGSINHDTTLAYALPDPFQNNTDIQSTTSPTNQRINASSEVSALVNKGDVLYDQGNNTQAIQYYDKALAIDPNNKDALNEKGNALSGQGNYTQAIPYYDKALAIDPNDKVILTDKADALFHRVTIYDFGNYTQAIQYYNKATQAIQYYDDALAIDPKYKDALNGKGRALDGIGNAFLQPR